jgi:hypothetical protein
MMTIIGFIALGFGVAFEFSNHARRDRIIKKMLTQYRESATHMKRAMECQHARDRQLPYRPAERLRLLSSDRRERGNASIPKGGFRFWDEQLNHHLYWGNKIYDEPQGMPEDNLRAIEAKLLLP